MTINDRITLLRKHMMSHGIAAVIIPTSDPHQSEYPAHHWRDREWISGFTGSAGVVVVTLEESGLWTDSRYFLQGEVELADTEVQLHKNYNQFATPYVDYLTQNLSTGSVIAVNGWNFSTASIESMKESFDVVGMEFITYLDLISEIWSDRPTLSAEPVFIHDVKYAGSPSIDKIAQVCTQIAEYGATHHLVTALDDIAWLCNLRGKDVEYNPVFVAYALVNSETTTLYMDKQKVDTKVRAHLKKNGIELQPYDRLFADLNNLPAHSKVVVDKYICNYPLYRAINGTIIDGNSIVSLLKSKKSDTEISHYHQVMRKDGASIARAFHWLEQELASGSTPSEYDMAHRLGEYRAMHGTYLGESFAAIIGYESNGAIIHYHPSIEDSQTIHPHGILLVDNGGQFLDGTTDITRTIALSSPTAEQKKHYTLILKGMITLSMAHFPVGTVGTQLDTLARQFLWSHGLTYLHGTGHGVGFCLNVHEGPQGFTPIHSAKGRVPFSVGMVLSNEPGFYIDGQYGMRVENLMVVVESRHPGFLSFDTLTLYPFDHTLIDKSLLSRAELAWINSYHSTVYRKVSPLLDGDLKVWFKDKCRRV
jgi:Xaa-Pro aminopeptidase